MANYNSKREFPKVFARDDMLAGDRADTFEQAAVTAWTTKLKKYLSQTGYIQKDFLDGDQTKLAEVGEVPPVINYDKH